MKKKIITNALIFVILVAIAIIFSIIIAGNRGEYIDLPNFISNNIANIILFILNIVIFSFISIRYIYEWLEYKLPFNSYITAYISLIADILLVVTFFILYHYDGFVLDIISTFLLSFLIGVNLILGCIIFYPLLRFICFWKNPIN